MLRDTCAEFCAVSAALSSARCSWRRQEGPADALGGEVGLSSDFFSFLRPFPFGRLFPSTLFGTKTLWMNCSASAMRSSGRAGRNKKPFSRWVSLCYLLRRGGDREGREANARLSHGLKSCKITPSLVIPTSVSRNLFTFITLLYCVFLLRCLGIAEVSEAALIGITARTRGRATKGISRSSSSRRAAGASPGPFPIPRYGPPPSLFRRKPSPWCSSTKP